MIFYAYNSAFALKLSFITKRKFHKEKIHSIAVKAFSRNSPESASRNSGSDRRPIGRIKFYYRLLLLFPDFIARMQPPMGLYLLWAPRA
ncbi:MAG: hypothetical protein JXN64_07285 [Spirochaetes bacterium]|nr:hypothetical protein [Spirochaetota bacterium]